VPTGIVTVELGNVARREAALRTACPRCALDAHDADARFCRRCGDRLASRAS
jgi:voltage-gated potassium channel